LDYSIVRLMEIDNCLLLIVHWFNTNQPLCHSERSEESSLLNLKLELAIAEEILQSLRSFRMTIS